MCPRMIRRNVLGLRVIWCCWAMMTFCAGPARARKAKAVRNAEIRKITQYHANDIQSMQCHECMDGYNTMPRMKVYKVPRGWEMLS